MIEWIHAHEAYLWWLFAFSVVTFIGSLVLVPVLVVRIPRDYFTHERRHFMPWQRWHPLAWLLVLVVKNAAGLVLLFMGFVMLFTPGQGLITILVGLLLLNYPGKYRLERWLISRPSILRSVNWLRERAGRPPLRVE